MAIKRLQEAAPPTKTTGKGSRHPPRDKNTADACMGERNLEGGAPLASTPWYSQQKLN
jgi:hypothetical protein